MRRTPDNWQRPSPVRFQPQPGILLAGKHDMPELLSLDLAIFLFGTIAAAFVTGLSGFAFGMVAAAIWFYVLPPPQASALIAAYALLVQGYAVWKLRRLLDLHRLVPFILGSALGIPV